MATARVPITSPAHLSAGRRHLFMAGVLLALVAFGVTFLLGSFMVLRSQQILGGQSVVVAARDIQAREALNANAIQTISYPSNLVPSSALTALDQANGKFAVRAIGKGEVLTPAMVSAQPVESGTAVQGFLPIPAGYVGFTIPTSELQGVGGFIAPGDYLDVIATIDLTTFSSNGSTKYYGVVTKTIFTDLYVIRVGPQNTAGESAPTGVASSLTVVINSCDAEMWSWLLGKAAAGDNTVFLRYTLRSYKDYPSPAPGGPASGSSLASPAAPASPATGTTATSGSGASASTATAAACPLGGTSGVNWKQVDARFGFTKI